MQFLLFCQEAIYMEAIFNLKFIAMNKSFLITAVLIGCLFIGNLIGQTISGIVSDVSNGQPLHGANVTVKGTQLGTITDINGSYTIYIDSTHKVLVFAFIGM